MNPKQTQGTIHSWRYDPPPQYWIMHHSRQEVVNFETLYLTPNQLFSIQYMGTTYNSDCHLDKSRDLLME